MANVSMPLRQLPHAGELHTDQRCRIYRVRCAIRPRFRHFDCCPSNIFFFKQKTAYDIGLGIPAEPLFRSHIMVGCGLLMLKVSRLKLPVIWLLVSMWLNTLTKSQIWTLLLKV